MKTILLIVLLTAACALALAPPYPQSPVIESITFAAKSTIKQAATGSDNWAVTWGDDNALYTAYGDGWGFVPKVSSKLSLGFAKVTGAGNNFTGTNIRSSSGEKTGDGSSGLKASGFISIGSTVYMLCRNANNTQFAYSSDHMKTWTWSWKFTNKFGFATFLNFGQDNSGARDDYVYIYGSDAESAYDIYSHILLARVPKGSIKAQSAYEYFSGTPANPAWSSSLSSARPVFTFANKGTRFSASYNAGIGRYMLNQVHSKLDSRFSGGFGIYDAPEPWGPFTTAFFVESWDMGPGECNCIPTKWLSSDGRSGYLVSSTDDAFTTRGFTIKLAINDNTPPSDVQLNTPVVTGYNIALSWNPSVDSESGISGYEIYRSASVNPTTLYKTVGNVSAYTDTTGNENTTYYYRIKAINGVGLKSQNYSNEQSATTQADTQKPEISNVQASSATSVLVVFTERVEKLSAENQGNYEINGVSVTQAVQQADEKSVVLTTGTLTEGVTYTLTVNNIRDRAGSPNTIAPNSQKTFVYEGKLVLGTPTVASGKQYEWDLMSQNNTVYIDRNYIFSVIPSKFIDMVYLRTANDDKSASGNPLISFDVNQNVTVYVGYTGSGLPSWLSGWTSTGDVLGTTDRDMKIYSKSFPAGTVVLGDNGGAPSMYTVLVTKADGPTVENSSNEMPMPGVQLSVMPNPSKAMVKIAVSYQLSAISKVQLSIYNVAGKQIKNLTADSRQLIAGIPWNASNHPAGLYVIKVTSGSQQYTRKVVLSR
jgi:hypothetical protein